MPGNHPGGGAAYRWRQSQINKVNILGRQNTFFVTNSGVQNRLQTDRSKAAYAGDEQLYIEGDVDMVSGRGAVIVR